MSEAPTVSRILGQTFSLYFANFPTFAALCALVLSPALVLSVYVTLRAGIEPLGGEPPLEPFADPFTPVAFNVVLAVLNAVLSAVARAAIVHGVFEHLRGGRAAFAACLRVGFRRVLPVLGVSIVVGLLTSLGFLACCVPGLFAWTVLAVAVPAVVVERGGVADSLSRSVQLTEGYRWVVLGTLVLVALAVFGVSALLSGVSILISLVVYAVVASAMGIVWSGLSATAATLLYYHLRAAKESFDLEQVAEVFS